MEKEMETAFRVRGFYYGYIGVRIVKNMETKGLYRGLLE